MISGIFQTGLGGIKAWFKLAVKTCEMEQLIYNGIRNALVYYLDIYKLRAKVFITLGIIC